ncbi:hypothetical protein TgHK011_005426 [Trichoderma gracile]|nr:hypothetical protein TgHK011_005426 [Trichoderma gracile]
MQATHESGYFAVDRSTLALIMQPFQPPTLTVGLAWQQTNGLVANGFRSSSGDRNLAAVESHGDGDLHTSKFFRLHREARG